MKHCLRDARFWEKLLIEEERNGYEEKFPERKALLVDFISKIGCCVAKQINPQDNPYLNRNK